MKSKCYFILLLIVFFVSSSLCCIAQVKKTGKRTTSTVVKNNRSKQSNNKKLYNFQGGYYRGEIGDYLPCVVKFQPGKTIVQATNMGTIEDVAKFMRIHPKCKIRVAGYGGALYKDIFSQRNSKIDVNGISKERALNVMKILAERFNISPSRMEYTCENGDEGFARHFAGSSDVVLFYEEGFTTLDECMEVFLAENDRILAPVAGAMIGFMLGYECPQCKGKGVTANGNKCSKCLASGYDVRSELTDGVSIANNMASASWNATQGNPYKSGTSGDNGWQIKRYSEGVYEGHLVKGKRNGWGRIYYKNGECYTGMWKDDKVAIRGMYREYPVRMSSDGLDMLCNRHAGIIGSDGRMSDERAVLRFNHTVYVGKLKNGKFDGEGLLTDFYDAFFIGEFKEGKIGRGKCNLGQIAMISGDYSSCDIDKEEYNFQFACNGKGKVEFEDGDSFIGNIMNGTPKGYGTLSMTNGDIMYCELGGGHFGLSLNSNKPCVLKKKSGDVYVGFGGICPEGEGTWYYASTHKYVSGIWEKGDIKEVKDKGTYTDEELNSKEGVWKYSNGDVYSGGLFYGLPNGYGTYTYSNGDKYVGKFVYGEPENDGILTYKNGDKFSGEFQNLIPHGKGKMSYSNGDFYIGDFVSGKPSGDGVMCYSNQKYLRGKWQDGNLIEKVEEGKWKRDGKGILNFKAKGAKTAALLNNLKDFLNTK